MVLRSNRLIKLLFSLIILITLSAAGIAQDKSNKDDKDNGTPQGKPVLWELVNISQQNLLLGPGGEEMKPDLSNITFVEEDKSGTNTKYRIKDGAGNVWVAKIGQEAQPETAAVRLVWGIGYKSEINYLVPELTIPDKGTFKNVRLEARPKDLKRYETWKWKENPFVGTDELQGLKIMMALLDNWDMKDDNNKIIYSRDNQEQYFVVSDLGATFGKTGSLPLFWRIQRSRNSPEDFSKAKFINKVKDGRIDFNYGGKMRELFDGVTVEQARWITKLLSQLSDDQIRDAFRAANYSDEDINLLAQEVKDRITELNSITGQAQAKITNEK